METYNGRIKTGVFLESGIIVGDECGDPSKIWRSLIIQLGKHHIFMRAPPAITARGDSF
jgi:hypothetical protein